MSRPTAAQRFFAKVALPNESGCMIWLGAKSSRFGAGYGRFNVGGRIVSAHRWSFEYWVGQIPNALQIDHLCRVRLCVAPNHLELVTSKENTLRGESVSAQAARKTHCPIGHAYSELNTYRDQLGHRHCRECARARWQRLRARKRAEAVQGLSTCEFCEAQLAHPLAECVRAECRARAAERDAAFRSGGSR